MIPLTQMFDLYAEERGFGPRVLHIPEIGFATYHLHEDECYIEDIFIMPEHRRSKIGTDIADSITEIAKKNGCSLLTGSVAPNANGAEISRKALLSYGFKLFESSEELEKYSKEI
jgi:GNAT superfamily N-acetyltransferase